MMPHPAGELGRAKQRELKPMMTEEALSVPVGRERLIATIAKLVGQMDFYQTAETLWAYSMVEHFLDVGWEVQEFEVNFRADCIISAGEFSRAMDAIIGRTCYDQREAIRTNAVWTRVGPYPNRADLGAFLFYCFMAP